LEKTVVLPIASKYLGQYKAEINEIKKVIRRTQEQIDVLQEQISIFYHLLNKLKEDYGRLEETTRLVAKGVAKSTVERLLDEFTKAYSLSVKIMDINGEEREVPISKAIKILEERTFQSLKSLLMYAKHLNDKIEGKA
jgi:uncharacterized protein YoxC